MERFELSSIDLGIMVLYAVAMIWYGLRHAKRKSSEEYFLAGRDMTWPIVGISLFAANISSTTLIGLSGDAYSTGISVYNYEWMATLVLVFFAIFFLPFYLKSQVYTMPEFLERRYDARSRYYFSFITLVGNVVIETAAGLYAGSLILKLVFPEVDTGVMIAILAFLAAAYTIPGGLSSVVHTEVIQAILLLVSSIILSVITLTKIGGWEAALAVTPDDMLSLIRPIDDPSVPWTGLIFGVPLLGFYFWANNQFMVQRVLGAKNLNHGRWGALFAGLLKLPVIFIMVLPGTMARVLYPDLESPDLVYPTLVFDLLPIGLVGLVLAGLLAAMSSSISATLNSASTLVTMDFVQKLNPSMSSKQLVRSGQIATVILVVLAAIWAPQIEKFGSLFKYLQMVLGYIAPPVVVVFLGGLFWKRGNATGAFISLITGFALTIFLILSKINNWVPVLDSMHFLHVAPLIFVVSVLLFIGVSLLTAPPHEKQIEAYIWKKELYTNETAALAKLPWYKNFRILSIILLILTAMVVGLFW
ncbi:MAG: sodium:solute symporter [Flammeovirgaceae bacterium]